MLIYYTPSVLLYFFTKELDMDAIVQKSCPWSRRLFAVRWYKKKGSKKLKRRMGHKLSNGFKKKRH